MPQPDIKAQWLTEWEEASKLFEDGKTEEAEAHLARCVQLSPETWAGIGMEMLKKDDIKSAMDRFVEALAFAKNPQTRAICLNNIGTILANNGRRQEALRFFQDCIRIFPDYPDAYANVGLVHKWEGDVGEALKWLDKSLSMNPHHQQAAFTRALTLLLAGRLKEGFEAYESRWRMRGANIRKLEIPWPEWNGHNANRVLIYGEQGVGDNIMLLRYAGVLQGMGLKVQTLVRKPIAALFAHSGLFDNVFEVGSTFSGFDAHISAFSLTRVMETTLENIPYPSGYIPAPSLSEVMEYGPGRNVGICWKGGAAYKQNIYRSTHLIEWREVLDATGITWHSLQVGDGEDEARLFPQLKCYPPPADYLETAKRIAGLDLVITVDTGLAHLSAAMGIPTWILIPHGNDFRWLLNREDSPWYCAVRLFRSPAEFTWQPVFGRIAKELRAI